METRDPAASGFLRRSGAGSLRALCDPGAQQEQGSRLGPLQVTRQGAGWQHGGRQQGDCTLIGWQQVDAQQQGLHTTAVQDDGQQVMGRQQPSCRPQGSQHTGLRQGSQTGRVQRGTQLTGRHTVVWQDTGRQQQGSGAQQGWREEEPQQAMWEAGRSGWSE